MVLEKIPTFSEVQTWANNNLVSSVNGNTGDVTVGGNGYINGHQSDYLNYVDDGELANCWGTIEVNSGEFTIVDNNTIEVNEAGVYSVDYTCGFTQRSGDGHAIMLAKVHINGTANFRHTGSRCFLRSTSSDGNRNSASNHSMHSLNAGDTIEVHVNRSAGVNGHDLTQASCAVQKLE